MCDYLGILTTSPLCSIAYLVFDATLFLSLFPQQLRLLLACIKTCHHRSFFRSSYRCIDRTSHCILFSYWLWAFFLLYRCPSTVYSFLRALLTQLPFRPGSRSRSFVSNSFSIHAMQFSLDSCQYFYPFLAFIFVVIIVQSGFTLTICVHYITVFIVSLM